MSMVGESCNVPPQKTLVYYLREVRILTST